MRYVSWHSCSETVEWLEIPSMFRTGTPYGTRESSVHGKCWRLLGIDNSDASDSIGGVLAWYSLIHHEPSTIQRALGEFARVLRPGGGLLLGFFVGPEGGDVRSCNRQGLPLVCGGPGRRAAGRRLRGHRDAHSNGVPLQAPTPRGDPCPARERPLSDRLAGAPRGPQLRAFFGGVLK